MEEKSIGRIHYAILFVLIIGLGLLSRTVSFIPLFVGDMLYAMMMGALFRFVFISKSLSAVCFGSLMLCFSIECSQLLTYDWLMNVRATVLGKLIFGQGFLWSDLFAYIGGTLSFWVFVFRVERCKEH